VWIRLCGSTEKGCPLARIRSHQLDPIRAMAPAGSHSQVSSRRSAFAWASPAPGLWHRRNPQIGRPPVVADLRNHAPCMKATSPLVVGAATAAAAAILLSVPNVTSAYGLNAAGRLEKCRGDEACISTSSVSNPSKFGPPWTFEPQTSSPEEAWNALKVAVENNTDHGRIVESVNGPKNFYLRAEFPSFPTGIEYAYISLHCTFVQHDEYGITPDMMKQFFLSSFCLVLLLFSTCSNTFFVGQ
jgi:hypothetical protein